MNLINPSTVNRRSVVGISTEDIRQTVSPLRLIFWGGLICVIDITFSQTVNGEGWKFDILNDFVGMLMITWGVFQLAKLNVHDRYRKYMNFVQVIAVLTCIESLQAHFVYDAPLPLALLFVVFFIVTMIAIVMFCVAMRWLSEEAGLRASAKSWKTSTVLFVVIYLIPFGLFYCACAVAIVMGESFDLQLGPVALLLVPVFIVPLVHLFVSTSRMRNEAESKHPGDDQDDRTDAGVPGNSQFTHGAPPIL